MKNPSFQKYCPDKLFSDGRKYASFLSRLVQTLDKLFNKEKRHIYFLESLLSQALWVAA